MAKPRGSTIKVWDPLIRIFHWSLVFFFFLSYLTEDDWMIVHSYAGYMVGFLVALRLIWGLIGTRYARFTDFVTGPRKAINYVKQMARGKAKRYIGHNPAGAAMIVLLLISLSLTVVSGMALFATDGQGPLADSFFASWSDELLEEIHELLANFTLFMVFAHVAGVLISSLIHRENLIRSMITGKKLRNT